MIIKGNWRTRNTGDLNACGQTCWPAVRHKIWTLTFFSCPSFRRAFVLSTHPPIRLGTKQKIRAQVKPKFAGDHYKEEETKVSSLYPSFPEDLLSFDFPNSFGVLQKPLVSEASESFCFLKVIQTFSSEEKGWMMI